MNNLRDIQDRYYEPPKDYCKQCGFGRCKCVQCRNCGYYGPECKCECPGCIEYKSVCGCHEWNDTVNAYVIADNTESSYRFPAWSSREERLKRMWSDHWDKKNKNQLENR